MAIFCVPSAETSADFLFKDKLLLISSSALRQAETEDDCLMLLNEFCQAAIASMYCWQK